MGNEKSLDKVTKEFEKIVDVIDKKFNEGYAFKNPGLVQHLLDKIQQEEDRELNEKIHVK